MQGFELAAISVAVADFQNFFEVATGHRRNAVNRAGGSFVAASDFQNCFEVVTGHYKYAVNRAGGHLLSSLFSLLPAFFHPA